MGLFFFAPAADIKKNRKIRKSKTGASEMISVPAQLSAGSIEFPQHEVSGTYWDCPSHKFRTVFSGAQHKFKNVGCVFFAYSWKLPAYSGAFLLIVGNLAFLLTVGAFLLTVLASLLTVGALLLTVGK